MTLLSQLSDRFGDAFVSLGLDRAFGEVGISQRPELAQFQCNGALPAAKPAGKNPRELADEVIAAIGDRAAFADLSIAGPGFINITLTDDALADYVDGIARDDRVGVPQVEPKKVVVDYGGPNVAKDLHVGHLRPAVIGESAKRTLGFLGHDVIGDVHLGDWGAPMGQLIVELSERQPDLPYFDPLFTGPYPEEPPVGIDDLQEMYPIAAGKAKDDLAYRERASRAVVELQDGRPGYRALWQHFRDVSIDAIKAVYDRLGVHFELWYGESTINHRLFPLISRLVEDGVAERSEGALVIDVARPGDTKEIPPLMMVKSDGATLYTTWDVATIEDRVEEFGADVMLYFVDVRQGLHFEQVYRAVRKAGIVGPDVVLEHCGNGTVNGPDGKPFKTKEGGVMLLRDLIDQIVVRAAQRLDENHLAEEYPADERAAIAEKVGLAALKFGDLHNHRTSNYIFDIERFTSFEGKTGPYLLYGAVRMKSILRNARDAGLAPGPIVAATKDAERNLMLQLIRLPEVVHRAGELRAPNHLAEYAFELTSDFSRFYEACHILREEDATRQTSWLGLVALTLRSLEVLLDLMAIEVPERM
ncbi:MAG: arginine--tRNA ligase [Acidimicrobiia bacterium]|nr:arginine--tRNA ligase [Acidimicrobiia bacterium]